MNNMFFGFLEQAIHETYDLLIEKGQKSLNSKLKERDNDPVMPLTPEDPLLILAQFQFLNAKTISGGGSVDKDISGASAIRWFVKTQPNVDRLDKDMLKDIISTLGRNEKINIQLKERKDEITIRLKPEVLGRLKIKVGWDQGMLKVNFFATTHIAKQALEQNLNILSQMLLQQGLPVGEMSVLLESDGHAPNSKLPREKAEINLPTPNPYPPDNFLSEIDSRKQSAVLENMDIIRDEPILSQIIEKINIQLKERKDEITIRLKPEVLGRLKIKVGW
ncbi:MAG: flagellar hook-length control protein FliK, partial [Deltaproteobacteria bacterium]|nr:flagellar hook-length control protein FliK [Deltaproteobacteria bacterium]